MSAYASIKLYALVSAGWVDLTHDVIGDIECKYGINGTSPIDRVADTGELKFSLRNDAGCGGGKVGYYSPGNVNSLAGWVIGAPVKLVIEFEGVQTVKFLGRLSEISLSGGPVGPSVECRVVDWMNIAYEAPVSIDIQYDQKITTAVSALIGIAPVQPAEISYGTGIDTFKTLFDGLKTTTRIATEFNKLALSELGYIYLRHGGVSGEKMVVEGRHDRQGDNPILIPTPASESLPLLAETGVALYIELGETAGNEILAETMKYIELRNREIDVRIAYGQNIYNSILVKSYPRKLGTTVDVLYSISEPIPLAAGENKQFTVSYRDPTGLAETTGGRNMITPVAGTDYAMSTASGGGGTDLTAYLSVTAVYSSRDVTYTIENTGATAGFVNKLQARGNGVYIYDSAETFAEDSQSIGQFGHRQLTVDQSYQNDVNASADVAYMVLAQRKNATTEITGIRFIANRNRDLMFTFMYLDIGDLIYLENSVNGISGNHYINGIEFKIQPGGIIDYTWSVVPALSLEEQYWQLEVSGRSELGITTILGII